MPLSMQACIRAVGSLADVQHLVSRRRTVQPTEDSWGTKLRMASRDTVLVMATSQEQQWARCNAQQGLHTVKGL